MKTLILGILFFLLVSEVFMAPFEKHGFSHGSKKTSRRSSGSSHRDKRACTWWFEWRVNGADVNNGYVTGLLNTRAKKKALTLKFNTVKTSLPPRNLCQAMIPSLKAVPGMETLVESDHTNPLTIYYG